MAATTADATVSSRPGAPCTGISSRTVPSSPAACTSTTKGSATMLTAAGKTECR